MIDDEVNLGMLTNVRLMRLNVPTYIIIVISSFHIESKELCCANQFTTQQALHSS